MSLGFAVWPVPMRAICRAGVNLASERSSAHDPEHAFNVIKGDYSFGRLKIYVCTIATNYSFNLGEPI
jgi:hypothetical protein